MLQKDSQHDSQHTLATHKGIRSTRSQHLQLVASLTPRSSYKRIHDAHEDARRSRGFTTLTRIHNAHEDSQRSRGFTTLTRIQNAHDSVTLIIVNYVTTLTNSFSHQYVSSSFFSFMHLLLLLSSHLILLLLLHSSPSPSSPSLFPALLAGRPLGEGARERERRRRRRRGRKRRRRRRRVFFSVSSFNHS